MIRILSSVSPSANQRIWFQLSKIDQAQKPSQHEEDDQLPMAPDPVERPSFEILLLAFRHFSRL